MIEPYFDALKPDERSCGPVAEARILPSAMSPKRERPNRTVAQIERIITESVGHAPSETSSARFRAWGRP